MSGLRLRGKHVLVTAAAQGIGRAIAERAAAEGAVVLATDINESALATLEGEHLSTRRLDVTSDNDVRAAREAFQHCDVLVNCAGFVANGALLDCSGKDFEFSLSLNVTGMFRVMKAFVPGMVEGGGGSVINIASVASSIVGVPNRFAYGATKAAVVGMTKSVAVDYVKNGVRCNAICPGTIQSPSLDERINAFEDPVAARDAFIERQPMGRLGTPGEVAALAVYLASDESAFTTGTIHVIDGGWTAA